MSRITCQALLFADYVSCDRVTGIWSLAGIFGKVNVQQFPCVVNRMNVYVKVSDVPAGAHVARLEFRGSEDELLAHADKPGDAGPGAKSIEIVFTGVGVVFPRPGSYAATFLLDGELVASGQLEVIQGNTRTGVPGN
jgi:hypothetical protein